jgi:hypothetical protein
MNRGNNWNREPESYDSCDGKDGGIVVCSNSVGNEELVGLTEITAYPLEPKLGVSGACISVNQYRLQ